MSCVRFAVLLAGMSLILVGLPQSGPSYEPPPSTQAWPILCDSELEKESCIQTCRDTFDPDKDYADYTSCVDDCNRSSQRDKEPEPIE